MEVLRNTVIQRIRTVWDSPETGVFGDQILRTDGEDGEDSEWFYISIMPVVRKRISTLQTECSFLLSMDYHCPGGGMSAYLDAADKLEELFRNTLDFSYQGEERHIRIPELTTNISGGLFHLTIPISFVIDHPVPEGELMGDLADSFKT